MDLAKLDFAKGEKKPFGRKKIRKQNEIIVRKDSTVILTENGNTSAYKAKCRIYVARIKSSSGKKNLAILSLDLIAILLDSF